MEKYFGIPCPICGREFAESDDIVVCPDCGAPHHRACYKEHGQCAFDEQHVQGTAWKNPNLTEPSAQSAAGSEAVRCNRCNAANPAANSFCDVCGARISDGGEASAQENTPSYKKNFQNDGGYSNSTRLKDHSVRIDDKLGGIPVKEVAQFVGENALYYLPRFKLMEIQKNIPSINISAMVFTFFYYFNRKMYKIGAAMLVLFLLSITPQLILASYMFGDVMSGFSLQYIVDMYASLYPGLLAASNVLYNVFLLASFASGFFANRLYFNFVLNHVRKAKEKCKGMAETEYARELAVKGRTNKTLVILILALFFIGFMIFSVVLRYTYPM